MKNLLTILLLFLVHFVNGQSQTLKGTVTDETSEVVMFATVAIYQNDALITGTQTDFDGKYQFDSLTAGVYDIEASFVGYKNKKISDLIINKDNVILNIELTQGVEFSCPIRIETYPLLINYWDLTQGTTFSAKEIQQSPHKN